jgi:pimeloyl-ACP methyl ester carboxylesterase
VLKKFGLVVLALGALAAVVLAAWYQIDGQPLPETAQYLKGEGYTASVEDDGSLVFTPASANGHGVLIMHGALIKPMSYARSAAYFAGRGYTVFVPSGPGRLSIAAVDSAAARLSEFAVEGWFFIGHSMGGFASLELLARHQPNVRAMAFWACAMIKDFSAVNMPMLFLWGDHDGLLPPERLAAAKANLPASTLYVTIPGGNHQGFAMYSHQFFDNEAAIGWAAQIDIANEKTAAFFAARL